MAIDILFPPKYMLLYAQSDTVIMRICPGHISVHERQQTVRTYANVHFHVHTTAIFVHVCKNMTCMQEDLLRLHGKILLYYSTCASPCGCYDWLPAFLESRRQSVCQAPGPLGYSFCTYLVLSAMYANITMSGVFVCIVQ
jgi:hypothetical protein